MKKIYIGMLLVCSVFSACNDEWKDELYEQMVSFRAPVDGTGVSNIYLRYKEDGKTSYELPVIVSGSTDNARDLDVKIGVDNDTLHTLNVGKYLGRTDLYYKQLDQKHYSFPSEICSIPAGTNVKSYIIDFDFSDLNLVDKWVLPLSIERTDSYSPNMRKGWCKALLRINLFNDYSGSYSATNMNIYIDGQNNDPAIINTRTVSVVDENSVFFYAGTVWEEDENRAKYKIIATFDPGMEDDKGMISGGLTLRAGEESEGLDLQAVGASTYEISTDMDKVTPYLKHYYVTMNMEYKYTDRTNPSSPIIYHAKGKLVMERKINTLIPDQDQAIQW